jgi:urease accessory protein UreE
MNINTKKMLLTKEDFEKHILEKQEENAKQFGLTLEEYQKAVLEGKTLQIKDNGQNNSSRS